MANSTIIKTVSSKHPIDILELRKNIPSYEKRIKAPQVKTEYGLFIFSEKVIQLTKKTKKKKGIRQIEYEKLNAKGYKNLLWLDRMYKRRTQDQNDEDGNLRKFKVIIPLILPEGYKIYDNKGEYYATVLGDNEIFIYAVAQKDNTEIQHFLRSFVEKMYIQGQCDGKYGFSVPSRFIKNYERPN